jgi:hypothetical protein
VRGATTLATAARHLALALAVAAVVSGWWFVRNASVYGLGDPLASTRHDRVVVGQLRWADSGMAGPQAWWYFLSTLFRSFWAQFGWMGIPVGEPLYALYLAISLLGAIGVGAYLVRGLRCGDGAMLAVLGTSVVAVLAEVVYYNLTFVQAQGRYLFPALGPLALLAALGWSELARARGRARRGPLGRALLWGWAVGAVTVGGVSLLPTGAGHTLGTAVLWLAGVALCVLSWRRVRGSPGMVLAALPVGLAALDTACLIAFVARYFAG